MSFYSIPMDDISKHFNMSIDQLKQKTYAQLEEMESIMKHQKASDEANQLLQDKDLIRIILEYLEILPLMLKYWSFEDVIYHIIMNMTRRDIINETPVPVEDMPMNNYYAKHYRQIETRFDYIKQYTTKGEELAERKRCKCNIYETPSTYQHLRYTKPIKEMLLETFPELAAFDISIYGLQSNEKTFTIYIKTDDTTWYVPFDALMRHDADAIFKTTHDYAKQYNYGKITPKIIEDAAESESGKNFFKTVSSLHNIPILSDDEVQALIAEKKGLYVNVNANPD